MEFLPSSTILAIFALMTPFASEAAQAELRADERVNYVWGQALGSQFCFRLTVHKMLHHRVPGELSTEGLAMAH